MTILCKKELDLQGFGNLAGVENLKTLQEWETAKFSRVRDGSGALPIFHREAGTDSPARRDTPK
ncbi:hypothetical protein FLGSB24_34420 [Flavobacterium sp. GSB-24]|nr:hypothetical protein FLGSB24_34420 [Flavobacterium sp. GSB-24]